MLHKVHQNIYKRKMTLQTNLNQNFIKLFVEKLKNSLFLFVLPCIIKSRKHKLVIKLFIQKTIQKISMLTYGYHFLFFQKAPFPNNHEQYPEQRPTNRNKSKYLNQNQKYKVKF